MRAADCKRRTRWGLIRQPGALLIIRYLHSLAFQGMFYGGVLSYRAEFNSRRARIGGDIILPPTFLGACLQVIFPC